MRERRSGIAIYMQILECLLTRAEPQRPTWIMQACNLRHDLWLKYLVDLKRNGHVAEAGRNGETFISITGEGARVYRVWAENLKGLFALE